jgi:type II secretory pathway pseudopilin PulG
MAIKLKTPTLQKNQGFSMIETLLAIGLLVMAALGTATVISNVMRLNRNVMATAEANSTMSLLSMVLSDPTACDLNLAKENTVQFDTTKLKDLVVPVQKLAFPSNGSSTLEYIYNRDQPVQTLNTVKIADVNLSDIRYLNLTAQTAKLSVTFDKGPQIQGPQIITRNLYLRLESQVVAGSTLKVTHCVAGPGAPPPAGTPLPDGTTPNPGEDIPDSLFKNLLASVKALPLDKDKVAIIMNTIKNWQTLGLVGKGRYISIGKFSSLIKDGDIRFPNESLQLCNFLSGHVTDPQNAANTIPVYTFSNMIGTDCANALGK